MTEPSEPRPRPTAADHDAEVTHTSTLSVRSRRRSPTRETASVPGSAHLVVLVGPEAGRLISVGAEVVVGRDVEGSGLLEDDGVSRRHVRVYRSDEDEFHAEDLGSRNGSYVNGVRVTKAALLSGDKIAVGANTILLFTRHGRYEEHILQQQKMAALGQLAGGVAHDFNNLLGAILGNVSFLGSGDRSDGEQAECLADIEMAARRAADLTSRLLSFARRRELTLEPVPVGELVTEATALLRRALPPAVDLQTDESEPRLHVMGDRAQLLQVLMNAGINAGHAMPTGGRLTFRTDRQVIGSKSLTGRAELTPGKYVRLRIEDTGSGMDSQVLSQVFQPFFSTKPEGVGTGLGMATAQSVTREHGGDIDIESHPERGSQVTVYLPATEPSRPDFQDVPDAQTPLKGHVLVADDELLVRSTARRLLRSFGLEVQVAADGQEALELLLGRQFDLAILSDEMRALATDKLVAMLRTQSSTRIEIMISSSRATALRREALEGAGVRSFLHKPFDSRTLYTSVARAMRGHA